MSRNKLITLILHWQKIHGHWTRQDAKLPWGVFNLKTTWLSDHLTNVRSRGNLKNLYLHFFTKRLMSSELGTVLSLGRNFNTQTLKSSPTSSYCFFLSFLIGVSQMDWQKFFCKYFTTRYPMFSIYNDPNFLH